MTNRKLCSLGLVAVLVGALAIPAQTAAAAWDRLAPRDAPELSRDAPDSGQQGIASPGPTEMFREVLERLLRLVPRLPWPRDEKEPQRPEAAPTVDPLGWAPGGG